MSLVELKATGIGPIDPLEIRFGERLNLITGDNGLGKSLILDLAFWQLTGSWPHREPLRAAGPAAVSALVRGETGVVERQCSFDIGRQRWVWERGRPPMSALVVHARTNGGFCVWDPARNYYRVDPHGDEAPRAYVLEPGHVWSGLPGEREGQWLCNGLNRDWVAWQRERRPQFDTLCKVLSALSPDPAEELRPTDPVRVIGNAQDLPALQAAYGVVPLAHASEAVRRICALAYLIVWSWTEHEIEAGLRGWSMPIRRLDLIVDELEAHLHPRWQRRILPALMEVIHHLSSQARIQILGVTHAPLLLASVETHFDPSTDRLFTVDLRKVATGQRAVLVEQDFRMRGDAASWLSSDVFDQTPPMSVEAQHAIERARRWMAAGNADAAGAEMVERELGAALGESNPFWPRWQYQKERLLGQ